MAGPLSARRRLKLASPSQVNFRTALEQPVTCSARPPAGGDSSDPLPLLSES